MPLSSIMEYIKYRMKEDMDRSYYEVVVADSLCVISAGMKRTNKIDYIEGKNKIWGVVKKVDKRSANEIIEDTFRKHNIRLIKGEEAR